MYHREWFCGAWCCISCKFFKKNHTDLGVALDSTLVFYEDAIYIVMNEWMITWCLRPKFCSVRYIGSGLMRWIFVWIMPPVQDQSLNLSTCSPACCHCATAAPYTTKIHQAFYINLQAALNFQPGVPKWCPKCSFSMKIMGTGGWHLNKPSNFSLITCDM